MDVAEAAFVTALLLAVGAAGLVQGIRSYRGVWRPWSVRMAYLGPASLYLGAGVLLCAAASGLLLWADTAGAVASAATGTGWHVGANALVAAGAALVLAGLVFAYYRMPRRLKPRWIRELQGDASILKADGTPAELPTWTAARRRTGIAESRGPLLDQDGVDLLWRNFVLRASWKKFDSPSAAPLFRYGLIGTNRWATPEGLLVMQPRRATERVVYAVETVPARRRDGGWHGPGRREFRADVGRSGFASVLWQEKHWPVDQAAGTEDHRKMVQKLRFRDGPGKRRRINTPYRLDAVDTGDLGQALADFVTRRPVQRARWTVWSSDRGRVARVDFADGEFRTGGGAVVDRCELAALLAAAVAPADPVAAPEQEATAEVPRQESAEVAPARETPVSPGASA